ncbi:unnamed protein product [Umbelopsis vinacea]
MLGPQKIRQSADELQQFADYLFDVDLRSTNQGCDLISAEYADLLHGDRSPAFFVSRAILTAKNVGMTALNEKVPRQLSGEMPEFKSADTIAAEKDMVMYPTEFLNKEI